MFSFDVVGQHNEVMGIANDIESIADFASLDTDYALPGHEDQVQERRALIHQHGREDNDDTNGDWIHQDVVAVGDSIEFNVERA